MSYYPGGGSHSQQQGYPPPQQYDGYGQHQHYGAPPQQYPCASTPQTDILPITDSAQTVQWPFTTAII